MALKKNLNADKDHEYKDTPVLSKVRIGETDYYLKDAEARDVIDKILNDYLTSADKTELLNADTALGNRIAVFENDGAKDVGALKTLVDTINGDDTVSGSFRKAIADAIAAEVIARDAAIETAVGAEETRAKGVEEDLRTDVDANADAIDTLNGDAETVGSVAYAVKAEETRAKGVEENLQDQIDDIEEGLVKVKTGEKILGLDETTKELGTTLDISIEKYENKDYIYLRGISGVEVAKVDASAFVKDGMIENVELVKKDGKTYLKITFNTESGKQPIELDVSELIDVYEAGNGLELNGKVFSVKKDTSSEDYLTVSSAGVKVSGIDTAIADAVAAEAVIARAAEEANVAAISAEETRAKAAEKVNADAISAEVTRAEGVETGLNTRLTTAEGDIDALEGRMTTAEGEIDALQVDSHTHANKAELDLIASGDKAKWDKAVTDLASEIARAEAEEAELAEDIATNATAIVKEAEDRADADNVLDGKITAEATARADADTAINNKIGAKTDTATADTVYGAIAAEKARAEAAEADLQEQIDDLDEGAFKDVDWVDMGHQLTKTIGKTTTTVHSFGDLADENLANLEVKGQTISGVKATGTSTGELTGALDYTSAEIASNGTFTATGSIDVTLAGNTFDAITSVGELAKYTPESVTGGKATVVDTTKFNGGSQASFRQGAKANLTTSDISYVEEGVKVEVGTGADNECLIFTNITAKSAKAVDTFTANGDDSFTANTVASLGDGFVTAGSDVSYTPSQYTDAVLPTKAAQTVSVATKSFTGTANQPISVAGNYDKANLGTVAFSGKAIELNVGDITVADKAVTKKA